jgi:hypothetical protein
MKGYWGISYFVPFVFGLSYKLWERFMCPRGYHLLDEVFGVYHYLSCDACELVIYIDHIDDRYCKQKRKDNQ